MDYLEDFEYRDFLQTSFEWSKSNTGYYWEEKAALSSPPYIKSAQQSPSFYKNTSAKQSMANFTFDGNQYRQILTIEKLQFVPPFLLMRDDTKGLIPYRPLDGTKLFLEFASLDYSLDEINEFADTYGPLTNAWARREKDGKTWPGDSYSTWQNEIEDMKWLVQVWEWLQEAERGNSDAKESIKKVISWNGGNLAYVLADNQVLDKYGEAKKLIKAIEMGKVSTHFARGTLLYKGNKELERFVYDDLVLPAQFLIQCFINIKMRYHEVHPRLLMNDKNELEPAYMPISLIGALWLQFYLASFGKNKFRRCDLCNEWGDVTEKSSNWTKHTWCANRDRVKTAYYKKKDEQAKATATKGRSKK